MTLTGEPPWLPGRAGPRATQSRWPPGDPGGRCSGQTSAGPGLTCFSSVSSMLMLKTRPAAKGRRNMKARLEPFSRSLCKTGELRQAGACGHSRMGQAAQGMRARGVCACAHVWGECMNMGQQMPPHRGQAPSYMSVRHSGPEPGVRTRLCWQEPGACAGVNAWPLPPWALDTRSSWSWSWCALRWRGQQGVLLSSAVCITAPASPVSMASRGPTWIP